MALHFVLGGSGRGKSYYVNHLMSEMAAKEPERQFIMLVPEQFTMQTQREMVSISPEKGIMNIDVQSFVRLAYRIFGETGSGNLPVLDDMGKTMILRKVLSQKEESLKYFGRNIHKKGYVSEIKSFLSELLQYGVDEEKLSEMIEASQGHPVLQRKLSDMKQAYQGFLEYLQEHYITSEEVLSVLCDVVPESEILQDAVICLDGYTGFTPIQYRLIERLLLHCKDVYVTVTMGEKKILGVGEKHKLFYMSRKTMDQLRRIAGKNHIEMCPEIWTGNEIGQTRFGEARGIAWLEEHIFRYPVREYQDEPEDISLHVLAQPEKEISFVMEKILSLRRHGVRYRDIAVVTGDMEVYGLLAAEASRKVGIPCFIDQKQSILVHPLVVMLDSLMDCLVWDFSYEHIIGYLRGRYSPLAREDVDILDNFLLATGVRGHKKWQEEWNGDYVFPQKTEEDRTRVNDRLNRIRAQVWEIFGGGEQGIFQKIGQGKHTVCEYCTALAEFLEEQKFYEKLCQDIEEFQVQDDMISVREYGQIYEIVLDVLDRLVELLGQESMSVREFRELLDTGLSEARVGLIPPGVDQVVIGDITRTRLGHVDYLFFLGVNDCNIPKKSGGGGVLSSAERNFLEEAEFELKPTEREAMYTEQFYLYLNLTKPAKHLYISFSETGNDGKSIQPAYLVDRIRGLFPRLQLQVEGQRQDEEHILGDDMGFGYLIQGLRQGDYSDSRWQELFRYYCGQERREILEPVLQAAFYHAGETQISKMAAKRLYGEILMGSVSQMERYASCAYSYFLQYGLRLQERWEHAVQFFDIGNVVHEALEVYTDRLLQKGLQWQQLSQEEQRQEADRCLDEVAKQYKNGLLFDTHRDSHLVTRLRRILYRTIWAVTKQMEQGDFQTVDSELSFAFDYGPLKLKGRVDRMDVMEKEDADYVTIVDYKTGKKEISLSDLYYGLQMQLIVYLQAAVKKKEGRNRQSKVIIPAGIFYYNIEDPVLTGVVEPEQQEKEMLKALRLRGLINEDDPVLPSVDKSFATESGELPISTASLVAPFETDTKGALKKSSAAITTEDFQKLMTFSREKLQSLSRDIMNGCIPVNPFKKSNGKDTACEYCPYHGVCQFDVRMPGRKYRSLKKLTDDEVFAKIKEDKE